MMKVVLRSVFKEKEMGKQVMEQKENERHGQKFYDIFSVENCLTYTSIKSALL